MRPKLEMLFAPVSIVSALDPLPLMVPDVLLIRVILPAPMAPAPKWCCPH